MIEPGTITAELADFSYVAYSPTYWNPDRPVEDLDLATDLKILRETWDGLITYGAKGALTAIPEAAQAAGFKRLILGVYDLGNQAEIANALALAQAFPDLIRSVCLGNEGLAFKLYTVDDLVRTIRLFRARFPDLLLTTSEPIFSWGEKRILAEVDYCLPIIHPWIHDIFKNDPRTAATWVIQTAQRLQILSEKPVLIKETGFPADGDQYPNGLQDIFWDSLLKEIGAFTRDVHLAVFEAFDIPDKIHFSAMTHWDCYWGMYDKNRRPKPVVSTIRQHLLCAPGRLEITEVESASVVITAHERPQYLREAVESALAQGEALQKVVIVNDNSQGDEVDRLCRGYARLPQVSYVSRSERGSSGTARNEGLKQVSSRYVCFLDDDDAFLPGKLDRQLALFRRLPDTAAVGTGAFVFDENGARLGRAGCPEFFPEAPLASMLSFCQLINSSVMLRTEIVKRHGGYLEFFKGEDWEMWVRLLDSGEVIRSIDSPLTLYRRHTSNISDAEYVRTAVKNLLGRYGHLSSSRLISPLAYDAASGEIVKAVVFILHGLYTEALELLEGMELPTARIARYICYRELGSYGRAKNEIASWADALGLLPQLEKRLATHEARFSLRRKTAVVGSAAVLLEQKLLAQEARTAAGKPFHVPNLARYFHQNPKNIHIEDASGDVAEDLFFTRVSLTSC